MIGLQRKWKQMMSERASATIEDYLGFLFVLQRDGEMVVGARLAELLGVSPPTVTNTLKRMGRDGLVYLDNIQGYRLTEQGQELASSVMRRHMLTEWMLLRMLKVPWSDTHSEAHQIEHTISENIEEKMSQNLDNPQTCPHGNPLPGYEHVAAGWTPLIQIAAGEKAVIRRIHEIAEENPELLQYLETNGIVPGVQIEIGEVLAFNETMNLIVGERNITLGFAAARSIFVEKLPR